MIRSRRPTGEPGSRFRPDPSNPHGPNPTYNRANARHTIANDTRVRANEP